MENFTPYSALAGGALIGGGATILMVVHGRIAGVSGIIGGLLGAKASDVAWRIAFLAGLIAGAAAMNVVAGFTAPMPVQRNLAVLALAGALVGYGTRMGAGCTSGHGVCGLARLSSRSLIATVVFMASAASIVFVTRHVLDG